MKISVIVPVYNASTYLHKCVDSILNQTYKDFEIILVNDGSTDDSSLICNNYAELDSRISVLHKKNEGPGAARESGLELSTGDYVIFIDSDDYVDNSMLLKLSEQAINEDADIIQCGYYVIDLNNNIVNKSIPKRKIIKQNFNCISYYTKDKHTTDFLWDKLFKKSLFQNVDFPKYYYSEDACVLAQVFGKSSKVVVIDELLYYHVLSPEGLCRTGFSIKRLDTIKSGEYLYNYYSEKFPSLIVFPKIYICTHAAKNYCRMKKDSKLDTSQLELDMIEIFNKYFSFFSFTKQRILKYTSFKRWLFVIIFKFNPQLCIRLFKES